MFTSFSQYLFEINISRNRKTHEYFNIRKGNSQAIGKTMEMPILKRCYNSEEPFHFKNKDYNFTLSDPIYNKMEMFKISEKQITISQYINYLYSLKTKNNEEAIISQIENIINNETDLEKPILGLTPDEIYTYIEWYSNQTRYNTVIPTEVELYYAKENNCISTIGTEYTEPDSNFPRSRKRIKKLDVINGNKTKAGFHILVFV